MKRLLYKIVAKMTEVSTKLVSEMSKAELKFFLDSFDNVLCDCDGVLYRSGDVLPGSTELLNYLVQKANKRIFYVSNNAAKSRQNYVEGLGKMGFPVQLDDVFHAGFVAADYIKSRNFKKVYLVAAKSLCTEFDQVGVKYEYQQLEPMPAKWDEAAINGILAKADPEVDCVMVGFDYNFSYLKVARAANYLKKEGCVFLASDADSSFPISGGNTLPGSGPIVSAIATTADRQPTIVGKPSAVVFQTIQKHFPEVKPERCIIFGDRAESDVLLGRNSGVRSLMVGTGVDTLQSARDLKLAPEFWADGLQQLWEAIQKHDL